MPHHDPVTPADEYPAMYEAAVERFQAAGIEPEAVVSGEAEIPHAARTRFTAYLDRVEAVIFSEDAECELDTAREREDFARLRRAYQLARFFGEDNLWCTFSVLTAWAWRQLMAAPHPRLVALLDQLDPCPFDGTIA